MVAKFIASGYRKTGKPETRGRKLAEEIESVDVIIKKKRNSSHFNFVFAGRSDIAVWEPNMEMIVLSSFQKLDWFTFGSTPTRKYLPDALAQVLKEEKTRLTNEMTDSTSNYGDKFLCVQDLCEKIGTECSLNSSSYLEANPVAETLNSKALLITLS